LSTVFDNVERKVAKLARITGFDMRWRQAEAIGVEVFTNIFSYDITKKIKEFLESCTPSARNLCTVIDEELEVKDKSVRYVVSRYKLLFPYHMLNSEVIAKATDRKEEIQELAAIANTLRDQHYSFMNTASNLISGIRDSEKHIEELSRNPLLIENSSVVAGVDEAVKQKSEVVIAPKSEVVIAPKSETKKKSKQAA